MKKLWIVMVIALCFTLCACPALEEAPKEAKDVHITAGKIEPGMTVTDVLVEVTIDHQPIPCRVELTAFEWDGYYALEDAPVPDPFCVRLDIFYSLPEGYDVDNINVTMECDGGEYDGTGSIRVDEKGCVEAWSHAFYGEVPQAETEPTEATTQPATIPQTQPHTHDWKEKDPGYVYIASCTIDSVKTYECTCGETREETVPAPGHDLREGAKTPPTCTENGRQTNRCKRCGDGFVIEIPATGHSWSEWVKDTGRVHKHTCSVCGEEETAEHNIPDGEVTCTDCGADIIN